MSEGDRTRKEKKNGPEYPPEAITDLLFWSFHMSQGSGLESEDSSTAHTLVHTRIFPALLALNPNLIGATKSWIKGKAWAKELKGRDFTDENENDDSRIIPDGIVEAYVRRVYDYRENSRAHIQGKLDMDDSHRAEAYKALKYFLQMVETFDNTPAKDRKEQVDFHIRQLATLVLLRDEQLINQMETGGNVFSPMRGPVAQRLRKAKGNSMTCLYGLSANREQARAFLPKEFQELWEALGVYMRNNYQTYSPETQERLKRVTQKFKETTGEEIVLEAK